MALLARVLLLLGGMTVGFVQAAEGLKDEDHELNPDTPKSLAGDMMTLKTEDGVAFQVYAVGPEDAKRGMLVIHEWWGLNDHIRGWADRLAELGYRAMAVDLYDGQVATTPDKARALMAAFDQDEANAKHRAVLKALQAPGRKVGVIGWCFGGGQSLQASLTAPELVSATVIYYGPLVADADQLKRLRAPVLGIFGTRDTSITPEKVKAFQAAMRQAGKAIEIHVYDADHAFANPSGTRYNSEAARQAWDVTKAFLDKHLQ